MLRRSLAFLLSIAGCLLLTNASARAAGPRDELLITATDLAAHLKDPSLVILQVGEKTTYDAGHIPGARFINFNDEGWAAPRTTGALSLELPKAEALHDRLVAAGISDNSRIVVVYSDQWYSPSTRVIFTLNFAGLGSHVKLLEGGMGAWKKAGLPMTTDVPTITPGKLSTLKAINNVVDAAFVQTLGSKPGFALVDGRGRDSYDGVIPHDNRAEVKKSGHIPGAISVPFNSVFNETESLRPAAELEAIFAKAGVKPGDTIVGYCHIGQQATAMLFAARTLGHKVLLYDGSMDDWTKRNLPLEGPKKGGLQQ